MRELLATYRKTESGASLVEYTIALIVVTTVIGPGIIALAQNAFGLAQVVCETTGSALGDAGGEASGAYACGTGGARGSGDYDGSGVDGASSNGNGPSTPETDPEDVAPDGNDNPSANRNGNRYGNGNGNGVGQGGNGNRTR
jgi:Flp pilus assembly pilin Flp